MSPEVPRRDFLKSMPVAAYASTAMRGAEHQANPTPDGRSAVRRLDAFDYDGVTLGAGRWKRQVERARDFYEVGEGYPYFLYFDRKTLPWRLW